MREPPTRISIYVLHDVFVANNDHSHSIRNCFLTHMIRVLQGHNHLALVSHHNAYVVYQVCLSCRMACIPYLKSVAQQPQSIAKVRGLEVVFVTQRQVFPIITPKPLQTIEETKTSNRSEP